MRQVILVGIILAGGRGLQKAAQAHHVAILPFPARCHACQDLPGHRQALFAGIDIRHLQAQVGVGVSHVRWAGQRAGHQQPVIAVVVPGDVMGIDAWNGKGIAGSAQSEGDQRQENKKK